VKITDIDVKIFRVPFLKPYRIALGEISGTETAIVRVTTEDGTVGYGEGAPYHAVTGDYPEDIPIFLHRARGLLIGRDSDDIAGIHAALARESAASTPARAAVDIALYDLLGKHANMPLYRLLGGADPRVVTDCTIGIMEREAMVSRARELVGAGFRVIKVKTGLSVKDDIENLRSIRREIGDDIPLRIDANQGWDARTAIRAMKALEEIGIDEVEQPLPAFDLPGLAFVRANISQRLMLDESVHSPADALRAVTAGACDVINIKLMKCCGILGGLRINAVAQAAGIPCMVGCMLETKVAVSAGAHLAASQPNITLADLDSHLKLGGNGVITGGFTQAGSDITLTDRPGLGVEVDWDAI